MSSPIEALNATAGTPAACAAEAAPTVPEAETSAATLGPELIPVTTRSGGPSQPATAPRPWSSAKETASTGVALGESGPHGPSARHTPWTAPPLGASAQSPA